MFVGVFRQRRVWSHASSLGQLLSSVRSLRSQGSTIEVRRENIAVERRKHLYKAHLEARAALAAITHSMRRQDEQLRAVQAEQDTIANEFNRLAKALGVKEQQLAAKEPAPTSDDAGAWWPVMIILFWLWWWWF
jgi:predicted PhzF superfamily epimerase YddE/YHI9